LKTGQKLQIWPQQSQTGNPDLNQLPSTANPNHRQ